MSEGSGQISSQAFADALARAKQLAAKLSGGAPGGASSPPNVAGKRSAEDKSFEPDAKRAATLDPFGAQLAAMKGQSRFGSDDGKPEFMTRPGLGMGSGGGSKTIEMNIPGAKVGLVIGKGGETIRNLQEKSGTKMYILQENMFEECDKPLRIVGEPDLVEHAQQLVMDLINDSPPKLDFSKPKTEYGTPMGASTTMMGGGLETMKFPVPKISVGLIIGKAGDMIKRIQVETGAKVQFDPFNSNLGDMDEQLAIITGKPDQIRKAQIKIEELVETALHGGKAPGGAPGGGGGGFGGGGGGPNRFGGGGDEDRMNVPLNRVGIIIGKGGETIRQINQQSGAHAEIDRSAPADGPDKVFVIRGTRQQIEHAKELIQEKISSIPGQFNNNKSGGEYGGWSGGGGGGGGGYGQQQQSWGGGGGGEPDKMMGGVGADQWAAYYAQFYGGSQAQGGGGAAAPQQADYTQQWIVYLRQQGQHEQANQLEQQYKARAGGGPQMGAQNGNGQAPGGGGPPQNGGGGQQQADYSAQWAEHYRSIGKIAEAEQIEAYIKAQKAGGGGPGGPQPGQQPQGGPGGQQQPYGNFYQQQQQGGYPQQGGGPPGRGGGGDAPPGEG